jgi:hypothetical protein
MFLAQLAGEPLSPTKILAREKLIIALGFLTESWPARTCPVQLHVILPSDGALTGRTALADVNPRRDARRQVVWGERGINFIGTNRMSSELVYDGGEQTERV